jgi:flagellar basal-body rod protein FlgC
MDYRDAFAISATGLNFEKLRLDAAAANLANMHTTAGTEAARFRPLRVVAVPGNPFGVQLQQAGAAQGLGITSARLETVDAPPRFINDPGHPHADANGMVAYPGVDHVTETITLSNALRAYQANVAAMNIAKSMALKALDIGGNK